MSEYYGIVIAVVVIIGIAYFLAYGKYGNRWYRAD